MPIYQCRVIVGSKALEEHEARLRARDSASGKRAARETAENAAEKVESLD